MKKHFRALGRGTGRALLWLGRAAITVAEEIVGFLWELTTTILHGIADGIANVFRRHPLVVSAVVGGGVLWVFDPKGVADLAGAIIAIAILWLVFKQVAKVMFGGSGNSKSGGDNRK